MDKEARFRSKLEALGLKHTEQRRGVLTAVCGLGDHFDVEDVVEYLRASGVETSRATVYRTMPVLVHSGVVREVHSDHRHKHYEIAGAAKHHDHLVCAECGSVAEFADPRIEELQSEVCTRHGFLARSHRMEISGLCRACRRV